MKKTNKIDRFIEMFDADGIWVDENLWEDSVCICPVDKEKGVRFGMNLILPKKEVIRWLKKQKQPIPKFLKGGEKK